MDIKSEVMRRLGVDEMMAVMLLDEFFNSLDSDLEAIQKAIDSKNPKEIAKKAHYLKGSCANLAMDDVAKKLNEIELMGESNQTEGYDLESVRKMFDEIKNSLYE